MKILMFISCILMPIISFSQLKSELKQITNLVIEQLEMDSMDIYYKFTNANMRDDFIEARTNYDMLQIDKYLSPSDSSSFDKWMELTQDDVSIDFESLKLQYDSNLNLITKTSSKKISKYVKGNYQRKRTLPLVYISIPLIADNKKSAIVYCFYNCGELCGEIGIQYLVKDKGKWIIDNYRAKVIY